MDLGPIDDDRVRNRITSMGAHKDEQAPGDDSIRGSAYITVQVCLEVF